MLINNKNKCVPFVGPSLEKIYEVLQARAEGINMSVAYLELPPHASTVKHYHPNMTEIYYVIEGSAKLLLKDEIKEIFKNDIVLIEKNSIHQLSNHSNQVLHLLTVSSPAWAPDSEVAV